MFPESTGFAAGSDYESAILSGLCEVIERDSLALWWLHQLPTPRIDLGAWHAGVMRELLDRAERVGLDTQLFDLTSDLGVPVVGLVQTCRRGWPRVVAMGVCRTSSAAAALRVVEEAGSLRIALGWSKPLVDRDIVRQGAPCPPMDFGLYYAGDDGPERFAFATQAAPIRSALPRFRCWRRSARNDREAFG